MYQYRESNYDVLKSIEYTDADMLALTAVVILGILAALAIFDLLAFTFYSALGWWQNRGKKGMEL